MVPAGWELPLVRLIVGTTIRDAEGVPRRWTMISLGLMEGVLSATVGVLFLIGAANENAPLHKIFGPVVVLTVGVVAYGVHASGAMHEAPDMIGLGFFALVAFFVPLAIMRAGWKMSRAMDASESVNQAAQARHVAAASQPAVELPAARKVA